MIDVDLIDELDGNTAADALVRVRGKLLAAEAERLLLAAHWADLHAPEELSPAELALSPRDPAGRVLVLPGCERLVPAGAEGTPEVGEFAAAELAALLGVSTRDRGPADRRCDQPAAPPPCRMGTDQDRDRADLGC